MQSIQGCGAAKKHNGQQGRHRWENPHHSVKFWCFFKESLCDLLVVFGRNLGQKPYFWLEMCVVRGVSSSFSNVFCWPALSIHFSPMMSYPLIWIQSHHADQWFFRGICQKKRAKQHLINNILSCSHHLKCSRPSNVNTKEACVASVRPQMGNQIHIIV